MNSVALSDHVAVLVHGEDSDFELTPKQQLLKKIYARRDDINLVDDFWLAAIDDGMLDDVTIRPYNLYHNATQYFTDPIDGMWKVDVEATRVELARWFKYARSKGHKVDKEYTNSDFNLRINVSDRIHGSQVTIYTSRDIACTKRVVGIETIPAVPERTREIVEWDCEKISLLALAPSESE